MVTWRYAKGGLGSLGKPSSGRLLSKTIITTIIHGWTHLLVVGEGGG